MAVVASDDFNRADAGTLGANWTNQIGSIDIVSNRAKTTVDATEIAFYSGASFSADQYAQILAAAVGLTAQMGPSVRASGVTPNHNLYTLLWNASGASQGLYKLVNGSPTLLQSINGNISANDTMYVSIAGTTLVCKKNGAQLGSDQSDVTFASGNPGFFNNQSAAIEGIMDDWEGGDIVAELQVLLGEPVVGASLF